MSVKTNLTDKPLVDYSFTVDVPTLNPAEMSGSTGNISITTEPINGYQFLRGKEFSLEDSRFGAESGVVGSVESSEGGAAVVTGESLLRKLTATVTIRPKYLVSTGECMDAALSIAGFVSAGLPRDNIDSFPGWYGSLFDYVKHFCAAYGMEYYRQEAKPDVLFFRPVGQTQLNARGVSSFSETLSDQSLAQSVEVLVRDYVVPSNVSDNLEFTPEYADGEPQILTVDPGATIEYEIKIRGWAEQVNQPQAVDYVGPGKQSGLGSYCVAGNDGLPISAAQWTAQGGKVLVGLGEDPSVIKVTVTAPNRASLPSSDGTTDRYGPYSIAATSVLDNTFYNSLHITGKGICTKNQTIVCPTGVSVGISVDTKGYWNLLAGSWAGRITVDSFGSVYVCDAYPVAGTYAVRKYSPDGTLLLSVPSPNPGAVTVDSLGHIYVTDYLGKLVYKYSSTGAAITSWSTVGYPEGIATDSTNNLYVVDGENKAIRKFSSSGSAIGTWSTSSNFFDGIAIDSYDNVYAADRTGHQIHKFNSSGTEINRWSTVDRAYHISIDPSNNVYVFTFGSEDWGDLRGYTSAGVPTFIRPWTEFLSGPGGIAVSEDGLLYASYVDSVYRYTATGSITTVESVGATIDNPFVRNEDIGWGIAVAAAQAFGGANHTFSASIVPMGNDISDTIGSILSRGLSRLRVESATVSASGLTITGSARETFADFDTLWVGKTIGDFDTVWSGKTFNDQASAPLWVG